MRFSFYDFASACGMLMVFTPSKERHNTMHLNAVRENPETLVLCCASGVVASSTITSNVPLRPLSRMLRFESALTAAGFSAVFSRVGAASRVGLCCTRAPFMQRLHIAHSVGTPFDIHRAIIVRSSCCALKTLLFCWRLATVLIQDSRRGSFSEWYNNGVYNESDTHYTLSV